MQRARGWAPLWPAAGLNVPETKTTGGFKLWEGQRFKTTGGFKPNSGMVSVAGVIWLWGWITLAAFKQEEFADAVAGEI